MKKSILILIYFCSFACLCRGGTAGPSDDEIFLLIIPVILCILYLGVPAIVKFLKEKINAWRERTHIPNHHNGFTE